MQAGAPGWFGTKLRVSTEPLCPVHEHGCQHVRGGGGLRGGPQESAVTYFGPCGMDRVAQATGRGKGLEVEVPGLNTVD